MKLNSFNLQNIKLSNTFNKKYQAEIQAKASNIPKYYI